MIRYECKCCGCDFSEEEGREKHTEYPDFYGEIACPNCGAEYDEEERYLERYND